MTSTILWVVGEPGLGKTTLVRQLLPSQISLHSNPKWTISDAVVAAGHYTGHTFDGADRVPYSGVNDALAFWGAYLSSSALTVFDGDRFSYNGVREWFNQNIFDQRQLCVLVEAEAHIGKARRATRGSAQATSWVKGRVTKARRFWSGFEPAARLVIHADADSSTMFGELRCWLDQQGGTNGKG